MSDKSDNKRTALTARDRAKIKLLEYLGNPENEFISRTRLSTEVLGYKSTNQLNCLFTSLELQDIENEALALRLQATARQRGNLYKKLYDAGMDGDVKAAEIYLNRTEGKAVDRIALKAEIDQDINVHANLDDKALDAAILTLRKSIEMTEGQEVTESREKE